ncbi:MAG: putative lipopolysaccharide heptosyltransferase III [Syntrophobacteraceae bacterium]|jgi:heptosyltransferase-3|nr:putative lipopolysaccharide heptosyltransferase III [Syntrophobacteraceae bacterium]
MSLSLDSIQRVLFIKLRHIGDVLLAAATCRALREASPEVRISMLVPAGTEDMLTNHPDIEEVIPLRRGGGWRDDLRLIRRLRRNRFDLAVNMTEGDRGAILAFLSGARYRIGIDPRHKGFMGKRRLFTHLVKPVYDGRHRALMDMDVLEPLGIERKDPQVELFVSAEDQDLVDGWLREEGLLDDRPFVIVHPTSRWLFKCWRDEAVAEVVDHLRIRGVRVVLTSGPDPRERDKLAAIAALCRGEPLVLSGSLTLKQLGALLRRSVLFFGVDTAPMHMAAALGRPVLALFGPSDSKVWGPLAPVRRIIDRGKDFPCLPCRGDGCNSTKRSLCLEAISTEEVVQALDEMLVAASVACPEPARS